ncbi:hypothetical protein ACTWP5_31385 [Streptomyces sp. 4N509B]|uniref:hypothetical protein n=1 Tax=Streptomyces sp. 4N509B TaxID=3457413 RepID=UPI003FD4AF6E
MRKRTIRAALPAAAVAMAAALALTGCGGSEDDASGTAGGGGEQESTQGGDAGAGGEGDGGSEDDGEASGASLGPKPRNLSEIDPASLPEGVNLDDLLDLVPENLEDLIPWEELEDLDLPGGEDDRTPATVEELQGYWYTGPSDADAILDFYDRDVTFIEDMLAEGDICYGSVTDGSLTLEECSLYGDVEWTAMTATLEFEGDTLVVTWDDGTVHEYYNEVRYDGAPSM